MERLRSVGEALQAPTALVTPDGDQVLFANREYCELVGAEISEVMSRPASAFLADETAFDGLVRDLLRDQHPRDMTIDLTGDTGEPRWVDVSLRLVRGLTEPGAMLITLADVTGQRNLSTQMAELARFPDMNPGPVLRIDEEGTVVLANEAARRVFGGEELVGHSWFDLCPDIGQERWRELLESQAEISTTVPVGDRCFVFAHVVDPQARFVFAFGNDITSILDTDRLLAEQSVQLTEFARLPDMNPGPVLKLDEDTTVLLGNRAALDLFGAGVVGEKWSDVCPDFDSSVWDDVLLSEEFVTLERPVGGRQYIFFHRYDDDSQRVFVYGADVTEQRRADELVRLLLASTGEGIYGVDPAGRCTFANPAAVRIFGFDSDQELLGQSMHELVHHTRANGEPYPEEQCPISLATTERRSSQGDDEVMWRNDGTCFPVEYRSHPMESNEEFVGSVLAFVDITERRRVQEQLAVAKQAAEAANEAKSQFLANMSHELRTPMNAIIGYSEMLVEDAEMSGDEDTVADLEKIHSAGRHLLELINAVLDLSKIEAGGVELHLETFQVTDLVRDVTAVTQQLVEANGNRFDIELEDGLGEMRSDVTKIRQSLLNLVSNAAKFTENGVVTLAVSRQQRADGDWISFAVRDTGMGIPADKLEHVFEEFAQASSTISRDYGGTGLGLPLTRRFSQLLGGDVRIESELGAGSTFTIELPARPDRSVAAEPSLEPAGAARVATGAHRSDVLVIDDDPRARELLLRALEREGYSVATAADGATGIELARTLSPSLITLDIIMPSMDGWAVLSALKDDPATSEIPVAMLSIAPDNDLGLILGAVESMQKPIDRDALYSLVEKYVTSDGARVLIVDDDEAARSSIRRHVQAAGLKCDEAENGAVALQCIAQRRPDLILLDLMMPVMDGFSMLDELRTNAEYRTIPVLVVTSKTLSADDRRRLNGDVERIIHKGHHTTKDVLEYVHSVLRPDASSAPTTETTSSENP